MAPAKLENEDHSRDAAFNKAMHKDSSAAKGGFSAMMKKDKTAQKAAVDEYFKHWDDKAAKDETPEMREVGTLPLSKVRILICTPFRHEKPNTLLLQDSMYYIHLPIMPCISANKFQVTTTLERISTNMDGASLSTSADSHTVNLSTKPLPVTNIILQPRLVSRMETRSSM